MCGWSHCSRPTRPIWRGRRRTVRCGASGSRRFLNQIKRPRTSRPPSQVAMPATCCRGPCGIWPGTASWARRATTISCRPRSAWKWLHLVRRPGAAHARQRRVQVVVAAPRVRDARLWRSRVSHRPLQPSITACDRAAGRAARRRDPTPHRAPRRLGARYRDAQHSGAGVARRLAWPEAASGALRASTTPSLAAPAWASSEAAGGARRDGQQGHEAPGGIPTTGGRSHQ